MKKRGFTLIEIIICLVLLSVIATTFILINRKKENINTQITEIQNTILSAADVLINMDNDNNHKFYINQLNLGAQGVKIKLTKLLEEGLIKENILNNLYEELKKDNNSLTKTEFNNYYIFIVNGSFTEDDEEANCNGLSYYFSWNFDGSEKQLNLCSKLPESSSKKIANVYIRELRGFDEKYYKEYYDAGTLIKVIDRENNEVSKNSDNTYTLTYGEEYIIEFNNDLIQKISSGEKKSLYDLDSFNIDKNYVFLTLNNFPNDYAYEEAVYYDLSNYIFFEQPKEPVDYLYNLIMNVYKNNIKDAEKELNYNYYSEEESGLYYLKGDEGTTYFYRGNVDNNYLYLAENLWRIVRINDDGSFRIILDGDIGESKWYDSTAKEKYNGYTQDKNNTSLVKQKLDSFYNTYLRYEPFITKGTFCNDTSKHTSNSYNSSTYKSYSRLVTSKSPTFKCDSSFEYGGKYNEYIGLITADELVFAGAKYDVSNNNYYLAYNKSFWTMTPFSSNTMFTSKIKEEFYTNADNNLWYRDDNGNFHVGICSAKYECHEDPLIQNGTVNFNIFGSTTLDTSTISTNIYDGNNDIVIRPVINLIPKTVAYSSGDGTYGNPYVLSYIDCKSYLEMIGREL